MFVPFWLIFLISGTLLAVLTIVWAIGTRQFDDQDRARYLPLAGLEAEDYATPPAGRRRGQGYFVTAVLVFTGMAVIWATLFLVAGHA